MNKQERRGVYETKKANRIKEKDALGLKKCLCQEMIQSIKFQSVEALLVFMEEKYDQVLEKQEREHQPKIHKLIVKQLLNLRDLWRSRHRTELKDYLSRVKIRLDDKEYSDIIQQKAFFNRYDQGIYLFNRDQIGYLKVYIYRHLGRIRRQYVERTFYVPEANKHLDFNPGHIRFKSQVIEACNLLRNIGKQISEVTNI